MILFLFSLIIYDNWNIYIQGLPDAASIDAASWVEPENDRTVIIDASTAFRVDEAWDYGFPGTSSCEFVFPAHILKNKKYVSTYNY